MNNKTILVDTCILYDLKEKREGLIPNNFLSRLVDNNKIALTPINLFEILCGFEYDDNEISDFLYYVHSNIKLNNLYYDEKFFDDVFLESLVKDISSNITENYNVYRNKTGRYISNLYATYYSEFLTFLIVYVIDMNIKLINKKKDSNDKLTKKANHIIEGKMRQVFNLVESESWKIIEQKKLVKSNINILIQTIFRNLMIPLMKRFVEKNSSTLTHAKNAIGVWNQQTTNEYLLKHNQTERDIDSLSKIFSELLKQAKKHDKKVKEHENINFILEDYIDDIFHKIDTNYGKNGFIKNYYLEFIKSAFSSRLNFDSNNIKDLSLLLSFERIEKCDGFITSDKSLFEFIKKSNKFILQDNYIFIKRKELY
jgi:hypothetical protein